MNLLDWILIGIGSLFAFAGWRQGFIRGALSMAGFLAGALFAAFVLPALLSRWITPTLTRGLISVGIVLACAFTGQALAGWLGRKVRNDWTWRPATLLDSVAGAAFYVVALSIVVWVVASALALLPESPVSSAVNSSKVIASIDSVIPAPARRASAGLQGVLDASGFPRVFDSIVEPTALPVAAPNDSLLADPSLRRASASLVKVSGLASDCSEQITGSGFVFAPERVMTNAHVVAGVEDPTVQVDGVGRMLSASVVYFDPAIDVAVLAVPDLTAVPLRFGGVAGRGSDAVVAGFPGGGKLTAEAARVRGRITAQGQDIHGTGPVTRDIYSLRSRVLPGNSGGPLLSPTGLVYGVVFAAASRDPSTGYALTADEVAAAAAAGRKATQAVPTGSCIAG